MRAVDVDAATAEEYLAATAVGQALSFWARRLPDVLAVDGPTGSMTFAEIDGAANRFVRALRARGLGAGDSVAVMVANRPQFCVAYFGALRGGFRFTPINWHLTADEAAYIVNDCEARAFLADVRFGDVAVGVFAAAPGVSVRLAVGGPIGGFEPFDEVLASESGEPLPDPVLGLRMLYTSGTTGRPKGVLQKAVPLPLESIHGNSIRPHLPDQQIEAGVSRHLVTGPLYHAGPLFISMAASLSAGVGVVLMDGWSADETLRLIETERITHSHMVPTMFHRLLALPDHVKAAADLSSLKYVWHGAAPCPVPVKRAMIEWWGPKLLEYYAATEGPATSVSSEVWLRKPGTVGKPPTDDAIRVLDDDGHEQPVGEPGTIYIKAPATGSFAYFKSPEKTSSSYRGDYYTLGDIGYLDADGYLFLTDRSADLIISGGVNIYPVEVENCLLEHPSVLDVGVIGVPDPDWGEIVLGVVELRAGFEPTEELAAELVSHCRRHLAHYKCPRRIDFVDALPRTDSGKLYKRRLRDDYRRQASTQGGIAPT